MTTQYWLVKSEPETYSWDDLLRDRRTDWTGVRNYAARLHLKAMRPGDEVLYYHSGDDKAVVGVAKVTKAAGDEALLYHSNEGKAVIGIAKVTKAAFPDTTADEEGWVAVELAPVLSLKNPVTLAQVKAEPALKDIALVRQGRLSVQPLKPAEFARIVKLSAR